ncbi:hypothetical protein CY0110_23226 [Crocosphaera chwakensis CCY0110]|uniref:Uncharacterized protein n=1 Tax=Crocosphaera chwakensis CCY0110 TaxID=391612 RepID=A3IUX0_9CHRO|nr:hypothetical protein CY0110_09445 [Crocosphaera chwakensis CCY0110]EAZ89718.1 hypothetical protein CY0110_23226 [Crocosphaera chwakensis CCY0110]
MNREDGQVLWITVITSAFSLVLTFGFAF